MNKEPLIVEQHYDASPERVWQALTDLNEMKQWYFNIAEFKPVEGFEFSFEGGSEEKVYVHLCKITEVVPYKKLSYSWRHEGFPGFSVVTFELFNEEEGTLVRITHTGLDTFPDNMPDFARTSFEGGWKHILGTSLKNYLAGKQA